MMQQGIRYWLGLASLAIIVTGCGAQGVDELMERAAEMREQGRYQSAIADYREVLEENPDNAEARYGLGVASLRQGEYGRAVDALERARAGGISADRIDPKLARALIWDRRAEEVHARVSMDDLTDSDARADLEALIGEAHRQTGNQQAARRAFEDVLARDDDHVTALVGLSRLAANANRPSDAADFAERAVAADEQSPAAWLATANAARLANRRDDALAAYERVLDLPFTDISVQEQFNARGQYAQILLAEGRQDEAKEHVETMRQQGTRHPYANYLAGVIAYGDGDLDTAKERLQTVLSNAPNNMPAQFVLGAIRLQEEQYAQAVNLLQDVVSAQPANAQARAMLATAHRGMDQGERASRVLAEGIRHVADDSEALALLARAAGDDIESVIANLDTPDPGNPETQRARLRFARTLMGQGAAQPALALLEQPGLAGGDDELMRRQYLALAALRGGETDRAVQEAEALVDNYPESAPAHNVAGGVYMALERFDEAQAAFERASELAPDSAQVAFNMGLLALSQDNAEGAVSHLERGLQIAPDNLTALMALAEAHNRLGNTADAINALERGATAAEEAVQPYVAIARLQRREGNLEAALAAADRAVQRARRNPQVLALQGRLRLEAGQAEAAVDSLQAAVDAAPDSAELRFQLAQAQSEEGDTQGSLATLKALVADRPELIQPAYTLAMTQIEQGNYEAALETAHALKEQDNGTGPGNLAQGHALSAAGEHEAAAAAYDRAVDAGQRDALGPLVTSRNEAGIDNPAAPLERWLENNPDDNGSRMSLAQWYVQRGDYLEAVPHFEALAEATNHDNASILNNLAWSYHEIDDDRALETARAAHELAPDSPAVTDTLGWIELQAGNVERAIELLSNAVEQAPDNLGIRYHYAAALAESGETGRAREQLREALDTDEPFPSREQAHRLMEELE
ncbi:PEP-CTERM system TPR-repeat protein PrsT [Aquisalimonas lutea]|uniref:XrtA/PEP-CTERM system TPR-repeat protein PrsT n=1 Tax=Aquisalimonas lutea TaxID=1327750 RepID=UPI0025B49FF8|nr:XrtA/PEP-CTERM system TPR-repeat protein PrsT [Aquisalimonas lutea]MDN3517171.1 PEP-CTERM system TPR-repeat protein PrsT [Aquisalimonas lutea]